MQPYERLADAIEQRCVDLRMSLKELASAAGMTSEALYNIRKKGSRPNPRNARALEDALGWEHGDLLGILDRGELPRLKAGAPVSALSPDGVIDFGLGEEPPFPRPRSDAEESLNEMWRAAKSIESMMRRQQRQLTPHPDGAA